MKIMKYYQDLLSCSNCHDFLGWFQWGISPSFKKRQVLPAQIEQDTNKARKRKIKEDTHMLGNFKET